MRWLGFRKQLLMSVWLTSCLIDLFISRKESRLIEAEICFHKIVRRYLNKWVI